MVMLHVHRCSSGNESCTTFLPKDLPWGTLFHERNPPMCSRRFAYIYIYFLGMLRLIALLVVFFFPESSFSNVGDFNPSEKMYVKLDQFPQGKDEHEIYIYMFESTTSCEVSIPQHPGINILSPLGFKKKNVQIKSSQLTHMTQIIQTLKCTS